MMRNKTTKTIERSIPKIAKECCFRTMASLQRTFFKHESILTSCKPEFLRVRKTVQICSELPFNTLIHSFVFKLFILVVAEVHACQETDHLWKIKVQFVDIFLCQASMVMQWNGFTLLLTNKKKNKRGQNREPHHWPGYPPEKYSEIIEFLVSSWEEKDS